MKYNFVKSISAAAVIPFLALSCAPKLFVNPPLVSHVYTADPSAHVFEGKIYIYPSHDLESGVTEDDMGSHFDMKDFHVFSMDKPGGKVTDHGKVLDVADVAWAKRQMWAPDAAEKDGKYYFYFPAKDANDLFKIGVAVSDKPTGPFVANPEPMKGTFSIDPAVFKDGDGSYYMYWGGIWGGQLQQYRDGKHRPVGKGPTDGLPAADQPALMPQMAKLNANMMELAEPARPIQIVDSSGNPILAGDNERRFFEAAWVHQYKGKYYLSYSTGDTHFIAYGIGDNPYGPFTYQGVVLNPVQGWTNHHSIVEFEGKWYLFYHDTELTNKTHLRNIKMTELVHNEDGTIQTIEPLRK
ncbi:glycoside hydrolase family 43 protein [Aquiflexum sp. TKW24L]|uniref:glycoside hydrolase family 43 protein n=1 Tax=Aquiflexum sp. TKW24L TaxID=2942212 RepID=UPI0020BE9232|nr:glycoside hydrolase family 43 protein [Aquiflexum sp. TKW24L]MCL6259895.1 glycoside hydrolase family 43 protein [Aquiflexum sp. TKW24L]